MELWVGQTVGHDLGQFLADLGQFSVRVERVSLASSRPRQGLGLGSSMRRQPLELRWGICLSVVAV